MSSTRSEEKIFHQWSTISKETAQDPNGFGAVFVKARKKFLRLLVVSSLICTFALGGDLSHDCRGVFYMLMYLVYDSDYRLYQVFQNRPTYSYEFGWYAQGWHEVVSERDIPKSTQEALAEKGMLKVCTSTIVLFHTNEPVHKEKEDE